MFGKKQFDIVSNLSFTNRQVSCSAELSMKKSFTVVPVLLKTCSHKFEENKEDKMKCTSEMFTTLWATLSENVSSSN